MATTRRGRLSAYAPVTEPPLWSTPVSYTHLEEILTRCRSQLELTARYLLDHETMDAQVFAKVFTDPQAEEFAAYAGEET